VKSTVGLAGQVAWQLHPHEDAAHEERDEDAHEGDAQQEDAVEPRGRWLVGLVEHDKPQPPEGEEKAGRKALHDVLAVDPVLHEGHRARVSLLVGR